MYYTVNITLPIYGLGGLQMHLTLLKTIEQLLRYVFYQYKVSPWKPLRLSCTNDKKTEHGVMKETNEQAKE